MATIKTKAQLYADAVALPNPITRTALVAHLDNIVASYENIIQEYTTVQRDALTPFEGQKIYNTTSNRLEYYSASMWLPCSQKETVAVDCSANPNYPEALVGDQYIVTVAGIIGGGSGKTVSVGDLVYCVAPNAGGAEASAGTSWKVCYAVDSDVAQTRYAEVSISSAELLNIMSVAKNIVPAPGAGKVLIPSQFIVNYSYNTTAYNAVKIHAIFGGATAELGDITPFLNTLSNDEVFFSSFNAVSSFRCLPNREIDISALSNPTTGNGTMTVGVYYKIHTL